MAYAAGMALVGERGAIRVTVTMAILEKTALHCCAIMVVAAGTEVPASLMEQMQVRARVQAPTKDRFVSLVAILIANSP